MPPCAAERRDTAHDTGFVLGRWQRQHTQFVAAANEAGMLLATEVRAADVAGTSHRCRRWRWRDESRENGLDEARWYLEHGVAAVWLLEPWKRTVGVVSAEGIVEVGPGRRRPARP